MTRVGALGIISRRHRTAKGSGLAASQPFSQVVFMPDVPRDEPRMGNSPEFHAWRRNGN
jgi:hypothetical protein